MASTERTRTISAAEAGGRLDRTLGQWLALSRREVHQLLETGAVTLNDRRARQADKGRRLAVGDHLAVAPFDRPEHRRAEPEPQRALHTVSEGPGWIILDKPAGMPVHPLRADERGTLLNALIARHPHVHGVGEGGLRSGVVHRLDVTTSGVVAFALAQDTWQRLRRAFVDGAVRKTYRAIVHGRLEGEHRESLPLIVRRHRPARVAVAEPHEPGARQCAMRWRAVETFAGATHLEVELETGFLHQIRVMLAHRGHPLIGDAAYGREPAHDRRLPRATRPMLHAYALAFEGIGGAAEPPADFSGVLADLRGHAEGGAVTPGA